MTLIPGYCSDLFPTVCKGMSSICQAHHLTMSINTSFTYLFKFFQGWWWLNHFLGQTVPMLDKPLWKKIFKISNQILPCCKLRSLPLVLLLVRRWAPPFYNILLGLPVEFFPWGVGCFVFFFFPSVLSRVWCLCFHRRKPINAGEISIVLTWQAAHNELG